MQTRSHTITLSPKAFADLGGPDLVYVREVSGAEVMAAVSEEAVEEHHLTPEQTLYALHRADGARLAVLGDRESAFAAARMNELAPVSVH